MHIRDKEIQRILKYGEGLGIKIEFKPYTDGIGGGSWGWVDRVIEVYLDGRESKTSIILILLHELGHCLDHQYKEQTVSPEVVFAYMKLNEGKMYGLRDDLSQKERDIILKEELDGISYMELLYIELNLKIPKWKVKLAQELDSYDYTMLAKFGRFSSRTEFKKRKKFLAKKMKALYKD